MSERFMVVDRRTNQVVMYFDTWESATEYAETHATRYNDLAAYQDITKAFQESLFIN